MLLQPDLPQAPGWQGSCLPQARVQFCRGFSSARQHTRMVRAASSQPTQQQSKQQVPAAFAAPERRADCDQGVYPDFEKEVPGEALFPKREPGAFPHIRPKTHVAQALSSISDALPGSFSLDTPATPLSEGEVYDPLRDGPLRYLGYANECGYGCVDAPDAADLRLHLHTAAKPVLASTPCEVELWKLMPVAVLQRSFCCLATNMGGAFLLCCCSLLCSCGHI